MQIFIFSFHLEENFHCFIWGICNIFTFVFLRFIDLFVLCVSINNNTDNITALQQMKCAVWMTQSFVLSSNQKLCKKCYFLDLAENFPDLPFSTINGYALRKWGQLNNEILLW